MAHDDHSAHHVNYMAVGIALCVFTALSALFDTLGGVLSHGVVIVLVLAVAVAKATCVMMYFMHLKFEGNWQLDFRWHSILMSAQRTTLPQHLSSTGVPRMPPRITHTTVSLRETKAAARPKMWKHQTKLKHQNSSLDRLVGCASSAAKL